MDVPVPRGGVRGLQGFPPGQASTTSSFSLGRISERNVEQIVEAFKIFFQDKVHPLLLTIQLVLMLLWVRLVMRFFALFPAEKSAKIGRTRGRK